MRKIWNYKVLKDGVEVGHANTLYGAKRTARRNGAKLFPETADEMDRDGIYRNNGDCLRIPELASMMSWGAAVDAYNAISGACFDSCFFG